MQRLLAWFFNVSPLIQAGEHSRRGSHFSTTSIVCCQSYLIVAQIFASSRTLDRILFRLFNFRLLRVILVALIIKWLNQLHFIDSLNSPRFGYFLIPNTWLEQMFGIRGLFFERWTQNPTELYILKIRIDLIHIKKFDGNVLQNKYWIAFDISDFLTQLTWCVLEK